MPPTRRGIGFAVLTVQGQQQWQEQWQKQWPGQE